jgi:hypothetical protein
VQRLSPEALTNLGERGPFRIRQPQAGWQVCPQNLVLGCQVLVLEEQFLIDQAGHIHQQSRPRVRFHIERP